MREAKYETVEIMVDAELLEQLKPIIEPMGLTPESLAVQFIEWCVAPETQNEAISLLIKWKEEWSCHLVRVGRCGEVLSKKTFCEALRKIQAQREIDEKFSEALQTVGNGYYVFGSENLSLAALRDVLKESVNDQYDYIEWWLYEATPDYLVWSSDERSKWCLKEPEDLYDFIMDQCQDR